MLQIGLNVPVVGGAPSVVEKLIPGEIFAVVSPTEFPKFNVSPVILSYDRTKPPSRIIFTHIPPAFKLETERRLNDLLMSGIIEQVSEGMDKSFCSSLLVVPKGKNDIRLVVDLRGPNKCIIRTPFRMPTLDEILGDLSEAKWFSTIDLTSAFFHVEIHENSRHLTNFFAGNTMYRFKRLPFGLCNAPDIFQEIVQTTILAGCKGVRNYLDDFLVHGKTKMEHDANLSNVLDRLKEHNVSINKDKCVFGQRTVTFLGYSLSHDGLRVEDEKMKAVREFRRPRSQLEVKSFLGLVNFSERFILHRAEKTINLRNLAKAEDFYWREEEEEEFMFLKNDALQSITKLGYFSQEDETELYVDASPVGLGAVLVQFDSDSVPRIISCASKALSETEKKYPQTQKEALAMVWGIERFSLYLTGKSFSIRTDSEANEFIFGGRYRCGKRAVTRADTWALRLQSYDFSVKRIPGHLNIADALSRLIAETQVDEPFDEDFEKHILYALDGGFMDISWKDIQLAAEADVEQQAIRCAITSMDWPENLRRFEAQVKFLRTLGPIIFMHDKIVLPKKLHLRALSAAHQGHIGCGAMKRIMRDHFWWPGMSSDVEKYVKNCDTCLMISRKNPPLPLSSRALPDGPWQIIQIDFLSIPGCGSGELLVAVDTYSRYLFAVEIKTIDAKSTNMALCKIFCTWGLPLTLQSDNGPPFQGQEFIEYWQEKGVTVRKSIPLSPQSNGAIERQNQGLIKALAGAKQDKKNWRVALQDYVHAHNTVKPHARLGITPFELMMGWKYRGTFPCLWESNFRSQEVDKSEVRENDSLAKLVSKRYADKHRGSKFSDIGVGDRVVVAVTKKNKIDPTFSRDRYTVLVREGAKVIVMSERGVQYTRNIQDIKLAAGHDIQEDGHDSDEQCEEKADCETDISINHKSQITNSPDDFPNGYDMQDEESQRKSKRVPRKPHRFKDMFMYRVYQ